MSDHFTRPQPGEDPLADRFRAFGSQHSHPITLPPVEEIHRGGDRRRRNQRLAAAGATLAMVGIVGGVVIASQPGPPRDETFLPATRTPIPTATSPEVQPTVTPTAAATLPSVAPSSQATPGTSPTSSGEGTHKPSPGSTPARPTEPYAGQRIDLAGKATMLVPEGWTSKQASVYLDSGDGISVPRMCLNDTATNGPSVSCDIEVQWGPVTVGSEGQERWEPGQPGGWYHRSDAAPCSLPGGDPAEFGQTDIMRSDQVPSLSYAPVGSKTAEVYRYAVECTRNRSFTSTMWWLPTTQLRFHDVVGNPRTSDILASVRFDGA